MSELLHPGHHPDADQLSAFAEHALPEHEHLITLAHLAECSDCRQIVFLSQQATQDEKPAPHATPSRQPWFKSLNLLWPAAAALSCGLLIIAFMHGRKPTDLPKETALASKSPAPPVPPPSTLIPQSAVIARETSQKPLPKRPLPSTSLKSASTLAAIGVAPVERDPFSSNQTQENVRLQGRNTLAFTPQPADAMRAGTSSTHGAMVRGGSQVYPAAPPAPARADSLRTFDSAQQAALPVQNQSLSQQTAAAAPSAASQSTQNFAPRSANETVEVTNAAPAIQTENAVLTARVQDSAAAFSQKIATRSLPSKRLAASSISNGSQTLAVDSAGDLFLSKDAGVNWQHITQQWTGRAIKVTLASPTAKKQVETSKAASGGNAASTPNFGAVSSGSSAKNNGFELITDTGTTWFSPDGLIWEKR